MVVPANKQIDHCILYLKSGESGDVTCWKCQDQVFLNKRWNVKSELKYDFDGYHIEDPSTSIKGENSQSASVCRQNKGCMERGD